MVSALGNYGIRQFHTEKTLALGYFSKEEIAELTIVNAQRQLILAEFVTQEFRMGH